MRGVILAAGRGTRLNGGRSQSPKCLIPIGGEPLLARNIRMLRAAGLDEIVVVVGCGADAVRTCCRDVTFVDNPWFARTNSLYSLWLTRDLLADGFVVMNCDVLAHPRLAADLVSARHEDALLVGYRAEDQSYGDEEMKVRIRRGRVVEISKTMAPAEADGENVGIVKFGAAGARLLVGELDRLVWAGELTAWAPRAFGAFAASRPLHAVGTRGFPWVEIDFPEDYRRAVDDVVPAIDGDAPADRAPVAQPA